MTIEHLMLGAAILLLASIVASKASGRFGVPALLVFLIIGMLAGSDGPGGIEVDYPRVAQSLGIVALVFILFAGGLDTRWPAVRSVLRESLLLSTVGVAVTAVLVAFCSTLVLGFAVLPCDGLPNVWHLVSWSEHGESVAGSQKTHTGG